MEHRKTFSYKTPQDVQKKARERAFRDERTLSEVIHLLLSSYSAGKIKIPKNKK